MVVEIQAQVCDGYLLKLLFTAGAEWLEVHREVVNQLNVFPVPDGDTGTNMVLTMKKASETIASLEEKNIGIVSDTIARAALQGARGNSGVILSQILRGFAQELQGHTVMDTELFIRACHRAKRAAYAAVLEPVEGTLLTVVREAAEAIADCDTEDKLRDVFDRMVDAARRALEKTPELLPVLKQAGVIDSGGQGFVFILEGIQRILRGEDVFEIDEFMPTQTHWQVALEPEDVDGYGYDVQFLMHGTNLDVERIRRDIDAMGWSTLVVGDAELVKVHVHVHDPEIPINYAREHADFVDDIVREDMQEQYEELLHQQEQQPTTGTAVVAVANGDGIRQLFLDELGAAHVIFGGQTMNPSTEDFLNAIEKLNHETVILLPNNKNIVLAAQQAAQHLNHGHVRVIPTATIPQGISAMFAFINAGDTEANTVMAAMETAAAEVVSIEITHATRDTMINGLDVKKGQLIGLVDGRLVAADGRVADVLFAALNQVDDLDERELLTLYYGQEVTQEEALALADVVSEQYPMLEVEVVAGEQPLYLYIAGLE